MLAAAFSLEVVFMAAAVDLAAAISEEDSAGAAEDLAEAGRPGTGEFETVSSKQ